MKQLILAIAIVLLAAGSSYSQPVTNIFSSVDFGEQIKRPEKLEIVKDVFQGVWAINVYSQEGKVVDTVLVKLQNYSTKHPDLIVFSSVKSDSLSNVIDPAKVTFFQSKEKSTIRFALSDEQTLTFDGVLNNNYTISAFAKNDNGQIGEYRVEAMKVAEDYGSTWVCGNDDGKKEGETLHGRHLATRPQLRSLEQEHGCTHWKVYKEQPQ